MKLKMILLLVVLAVSSLQLAQAVNIKGVVVDKETGMPLLGATVMIEGTMTGAAAGLDGDFEIQAKHEDKLVISYISYVTQTIVVDRAVKELTIQLAPDAQVVDVVQVVGKANLETEANLQNERIASNVAIENLGVREMSLKGLSNAEDGVKKMTGISVADAGQVFVRGLGDRYSLTTMNGVPIASPNPDNKLIPLDIFPSSAIQNITVSKVYQVSAFADYSGALIDIATRNIVSDNFFNVSVSVGGNTNTTAKKFLKSDRGSLFSTDKFPSELTYDALPSTSKFNAHVAKSNPFNTDFEISRETAMPDFGVQVGYGHKWNVKDNNDLDILVTAGLSNEFQTLNDANIADLNSEGNVLSEFVYDSYSTKLEGAALGSLGYNYGLGNRINYTVFYARNVEDNYKYRDGQDAEGDPIIGSNSLMRVYSLINNQLSGEQKFGEKWGMEWIGAYSMTDSKEPDRRQVMFIPTAKPDEYVLMTRDNQSSSRFFGELNENELVANLKFNYKFGENNKVNFGGAYRGKDRDFKSIIFYYDSRYGSVVKNTIFEGVDGMLQNGGILNYENVQNGEIDLSRDQQPNSKYFAQSDVYAGFAEVDYNIGKMLLNLGFRVEQSEQRVKSWEIGALEEDPTNSVLSSLDFFPAVNLKYNLNDEKMLRLSLSKTITRPSFIEMSPFEYKESYGTSTVKGNGDIENGYNYNVDLRYDFFADKSSDMLSVGVYYKFLDNPIERIQEDAGGSTLYSFRNTDSGMAAGAEIEFRKQLMDNLRFGINGSFIYTHVVLEEGGGIYTDSERQLQGASPYLINADLGYRISLKSDSDINLTLLYGIQGPRIDAVGVNGMSNVMQREIQSLDFVSSYAINKKLSLSLKFGNLLNYPYVYTQEIMGEDVELGRFRTGVDATIGASYKF